MIRALYSLVMLLAQPLLRRKLARRARAEPGYALAVEERFGHYTVPPGEGYVWVHAVSLGETRAAAILVARLRERLPGMRLLLTHGTATGRAEGERLLQTGDVQVWQPWDTPGAVRRFLARFRPRIGVLMETEVWPNLVAHSRVAGVPLVLANARLNERSLGKALRLAWLARPTYRALTAVWAQTAADAARLTQLGAPVQGALGNLKFDATPDATQLAQGRQWRSQLTRPVALLASSREGEEDLFLQVLKQNRPPVRMGRSFNAINNIANSVQWLVVPRHPQRFDAVAALIESHGLTVSRRSAWADGPPTDDADGATGHTVWLGDSLGEMALYYGLADVALLGGSFEPFGGQNLIEAAACGCPVIMGPSTFNFAEAADLAQQAGAAVSADGMPQAIDLAQRLATDADRRAATSAASEQFALAHRGAADKTAAAVLLLAPAYDRPQAPVTSPAAR